MLIMEQELLYQVLEAKTAYPPDAQQDFSNQGGLFRCTVPWLFNQNSLHRSFYA